MGLYRTIEKTSRLGGEMATFLQTVIIVIALIWCTVYLVRGITIHIFRLKRRDEILERVFAGFPYLLCKDPSSVAYYTQVECERNGDFIKVRYYCDDPEVRRKIFAYISWLNEHGVRIVAEGMDKERRIMENGQQL